MGQARFIECVEIPQRCAGLWKYFSMNGGRCLDPDAPTKR